ncbi:MAG TPA: UDP-3-O-(3-hydroxymyristoyl)glucosamine N-acyltransferase [Candidatus Cloacimonas sp.]|jgi:UDP-3-O-[3-hydroxymyristoyl] glucosamine N-acyltransferase|nr:UDP-3-O-(3-hydroxymyristoyl)glucosamine N-acyltransferase [Candidatus Cloacimonas sp.]MDD3869146.1 UDP-3-O-(3-hydroxymyristoyl)glucosamine N-acyltransferase [Candidatus Cloacimonadota bacterium]MCK9164808.1 UDP-3-O-(3-hydroxymyristoyl)glucosamine N-acyltransferase [Candidatus Cloacimonas sp.]HNV92726.1 UDP-3-O-(3-hydroxymyristoyl)glucosamine N-acyltransferase [Candidatus Cloacimonas sp.]HPH72137.1 UDP-3-O-(3-hydroxymyristoyl)glucosamine N-acyltransferase [Candidatus Cloacimonas sp.]
MKRFSTNISEEILLHICQGELIGKIPENLCKVSEPQEADQQTIIFLEQEKLLDIVKASSAGLIITTKRYVPMFPDRALLIVEKPYFALMLLITYLLNQENKNITYTIHPSAVVAEDVILDKEVAIGANVVIGSGSKLGKGVIIGEGCSIGKNVYIGERTKLYPNVCLYDDCVIGNNCILHSGVIIGADGFGFMLIAGVQQKIPQVGNVVIGNDVEIGANSCIDRATLGSTIIGNNTKIDNLVQIGHNCVVGEHSVICSQVGLAGSTIVGDFVYLAGQVGVADHLKIGNRAMIGAQSGVSSNIPDDGKYFGYPALDANLTKRIMAVQKNLPEMYFAYLKAKKKETNSGDK